MPTAHIAPHGECKPLCDRLLDTGLQMMMEKVEISCLCLPNEWAIALDQWICKQEM
jgi:hypothetical protein